MFISLYNFFLETVQSFEYDSMVVINKYISIVYRLRLRDKFLIPYILTFKAVL